MAYTLLYIAVRFSKYSSGCMHAYCNHEMPLIDYSHFFYLFFYSFILESLTYYEETYKRSSWKLCQQLFGRR